MAARAQEKAPPPLSFNRDVRPILSNNCFACHGPDEKVRKADLRLDTKEGALASVVVPGKPGESELVDRVSSKDADTVMPPPKSGKKLSPREIDVLTRWVKEGAAYANHWACVKPVRPTVPSISNHQSPIRNPVDAFILDRLQREGLRPSSEADRHS